MRGSEFVFNYVYWLYNICHKRSPNCGGSYIYSLDSIKIKNATKNYINKKEKKCFQNDVRITLNHEEIPKDRQSITEIAAYISKYNRKGINNPPEIDD